MGLFVTGAGWVTAGGEGRGRNTDPFGYYEGALPGLAGKSPFSNQGFRRFGRLDRFSRLGLRAVAHALQDAGLDAWKEKRDIGIVVSSALGCLATDLDYYTTVMTKNGVLADPNLFTYTLPNSFIGHASMIFGLTGTNFVINEKTVSGISALGSAMDCISLGECETMLAGVCDLGAPPDFPVSVKPVPGAIFAVIEKTVNRKIQPFGSLSMDKNGILFFNNSEIEDISMCVRMCLDARI